MTAREFYTAIASTASLSPELVAYAKSALVGLDTAKAKRAQSPSARKAMQERDTFRASVLAVLTAEPKQASAIAELVGESVPKVASALSALVKSGDVVKSEIKVKACKAQGIKGGTFSAYALPTEGAV